MLFSRGLSNSRHSNEKAYHAFLFPFLFSFNLEWQLKFCFPFSRNYGYTVDMIVGGLHSSENFYVVELRI